MFKNPWIWKLRAKTCIYFMLFIGKFSGKSPKSKKKKGRPNRKAKMNKSYNNLEDDLQYSSDDDHFEDFNDPDDDDDDDEDWQEVDNEDTEGFTVTVDAPNAGGSGWQVQAEDGRSVQIEAPNLIIQQPHEMVEMEVEEEHVDEGYDPMAFFAVPPTPAHTTGKKNI